MAHDFLQAGRKKMLAVKYIYMEYAFHPNYLIIFFFLRSFFMHVNFSCFVNWKAMSTGIQYSTVCGHQCPTGRNEG